MGLVAVVVVVVEVAVVLQQVEELLKLLGTCVFEGTMKKLAAKSINNKINLNNKI